MLGAKRGGFVGQTPAERGAGLGEGPGTLLQRDEPLGHGARDDLVASHEDRAGLVRHSDLGAPRGVRRAIEPRTATRKRRQEPAEQPILPCRRAQWSRPGWSTMPILSSSRWTLRSKNFRSRSSSTLRQAWLTEVRCWP